MILTPAQVRVFEKAVHAADAVLQKLEFLQRLSEADPALAERVADIAATREFLALISRLALDLNEASKGE